MMEWDSFVNWLNGWLRRDMKQKQKIKLQLQMKLQTQTLSLYLYLSLSLSLSLSKALKEFRAQTTFSCPGKPSLIQNQASLHLSLCNLEKQQC